MPLNEYQIDSYQVLQGLLEKTQGEGEEIFIFFSCTLDKHGDPTTKVCFAAEDVLMEYTEFIRNSKRKLHLVYYRKLLEDYYQPVSDIRKDKYLRINAVPTLIKWKSYQRLVGKQCTKIPLLSMVFEEENPQKFPLYKPCNYFAPKEPKPEAGEGSRTESNKETIQNGVADGAQPDGQKMEAGNGDGQKVDVVAKEEEGAKMPAKELSNKQQREMPATEKAENEPMIEASPPVPTELNNEYPQTAQ